MNHWQRAVRSSIDQAPSIIMAETGREMPRDTLEANSSALAAFFRDSGLQEGDRVALLLENCPEFFVAMWAARKAGLLFVPVNWHLHEDEAAYVVDNSDSKALVTSAKLCEQAIRILERCSKVQLAIVNGSDVPGFTGLSTVLAEGKPFTPGRQGAPMPYSSGTTGRPKGILRPLVDAPFGTLTAFERIYTELYGLGPDTVYLSPAPAYHGAPVSWTQAVLMNQGSVIVLEKFDAEETLRAIERYGVTHAQFVPTHFVRLLRLPHETRQRYDLSSLKVVLHGAAPCPPDVKTAMIDWWGPIIHEFYSGSERCGLTFCDSQEWLERPGTAGRSRGGRIHIVDPESGNELAVGEVGLVYFENSERFEYHGDVAKLAECFNAQGWGTHGDLGWLDEADYLFLTDRRSDMILTGGVNIYPQEIENILARHPAVEDVAVVGCPDSEFGNRVHAVVQLMAQVTPDEATAQSILALCRTGLSGFKCPRSIEFIDELPRQPNGKLQRRIVRQDCCCSDHIYTIR